MHRNALIGMMALSLAGAAAYADNAPVQPNGKSITFELDCKFRGDVKGFENCEAQAELVFEKDQNGGGSGMSNDGRHNGDIEAELSVSCNGQSITEGDAEVDFRDRKIVISSDDLAELILPKRALRHDDEDFSTAAWLKLQADTGKNGTEDVLLRGFCEIEVDREHGDDRL